MATEKPRLKVAGKKPARTTKRIEDTDMDAAGKATTKSANTRRTENAFVQLAVPIGPNGLPMIEIISQASETVPVAQYANVVVGPVAVRRWIQDPGVEILADVNWEEDELTEEQQQVYDHMKGQIFSCQQVVEDVIAEDRENILESVRRENEREAEEQKSSSRRR